MQEQRKLYLGINNNTMNWCLREGSTRIGKVHFDLGTALISKAEERVKEIKNNLSPFGINLIVDKEG